MDPLYDTTRRQDAPLYPFCFRGNCWWFRLWRYGPGLALTNTPKLFSERNGYVKSIPVGFGYRIKYLKRVRNR